MRRFQNSPLLQYNSYIEDDIQNIFARNEITEVRYRKQMQNHYFITHHEFKKGISRRVM